VDTRRLTRCSGIEGAYAVQPMREIGDCHWLGPAPSVLGPNENARGALRLHGLFCLVMRRLSLARHDLRCGEGSLVAGRRRFNPDLVWVSF